MRYTIHSTLRNVTHTIPICNVTSANVIQLRLHYIHYTNTSATLIHTLLIRNLTYNIHIHTNTLLGATVTITHTYHYTYNNIAHHIHTLHHPSATVTYTLP